MSKPLSFTQTKASVHLDAVRATAAMVVVISHWRMLLYVPYAEAPSRAPLAKLFYLLTKGGHTSVVIFFVLSGYLISGSILRSLDKGAFSFPMYLTHRLARLWSVLLPALVLGGLLDWIGIHYTTAHALYAGMVRNYVTHDTIANLRPSLAFQDALFLQRGLDKEFGSNVPLWSLSYEFWYYILFPSGLLLLLVRGTAQRIWLALGLAAAAIVSGLSILLYFPLWLAGAALHKFPAPSFTHAQRVLGTVLFVAAFFAHSVYSERFNMGISADLPLSLVTMAFLWVILSSTSAADPVAPYTLISRVTAGFSYTLYAAHFPALMLLTALLLGNNRWVITPPHLAVGGACLVAVYIWAYVASWLFEQRTPVLQAFLYSLIGQVVRWCHALPRLTAPPRGE